MKKLLIAYLFLSSFAFWQHAGAAPIPLFGQGRHQWGKLPRRRSVHLRPAGCQRHCPLEKRRRRQRQRHVLNVDRGLYICLLGGNTMNDFPPKSLSPERPQLFLVVHFYRHDTQEWLHMQPDQRITSAPHALAAEVARNALTADAVQPGAITKSMLAARRTRRPQRHRRSSPTKTPPSHPAALPFPTSLP